MARTPHIRHLRHRKFERVRHSRKLLAWLAAQAERLAVTAQEVFSYLVHGSALEVEALEDGVAPVNSVLPLISGTTTEGETLSTTTGTWSGNPSFTYQWERDTVPIDGATEDTYLLVTADAATEITVTVTATNVYGAVDATSVGVGPITGL